MASRDFFISYNRADRAWAEWIAWQLEQHGYSVVVQAWDFTPGANFALEMHSAAEEAERTIAVLSPAYLKSPFTLAEWAAAFASDPMGRKRRLIPVRVEPCDLSGLFSQVVYLDLVGLSPNEAEQALLKILVVRAKPTTAPEFPTARPKTVASFPERQVNPRLRILHLANLHFESPHKAQWAISKLSNLTNSASNLDEIDLLIVAGDLSYQGDKLGFEAATNLLTNLTKQAGRSKKLECYVVPGNHDVQRSAIGPADSLILDQLTSEEAIARILSHPPTMSMLGSRLQNFYSFTHSLLGALNGWRPERPWKADVAERSGRRFAVLQLNTVWAEGTSGSPILGEFQFRDALSSASDCPLRLWVMHHPLSNLRETERQRILDTLATTEGLDIFLVGHEHSSQAALCRTVSPHHLEFAVSSQPKADLSPAACVRLDIDLRSGKAWSSEYSFSESRAEWLAEQAPAEHESSYRIVKPSALAAPAKPFGQSATGKAARAVKPRGTSTEAAMEKANPTVQTVSEEVLRQTIPQRPLILVTATPNELKALLAKMRPPKGKRAIGRSHIGQETYYAGRFGAYDIVAMMCGMGSMGRDSVALALRDAITRFSPIGVIVVGIAFGKDRGKQSLGDVIVASQVVSYEQQRIGTDRSVHRGAIAETGPILLNRFRQALDWSFSPAKGNRARMHIGPILSGEKLVDAGNFKDALFDAFPQAIGGDMEAAGIYAAAARARVEWIVVKGISDWADGTKTDHSQPLAAMASVSLVHHVLSDKLAFDALL